MRTSLWIAVGLLGACTGEDPDTDADGIVDTDDSDLAPPASTFVSGRYRMTAFEILPQDDGVDQDKDGTPDNNLPFALNFADTALADQDLTRDDLNLRIAEGLADNSLVVLLDAAQLDRVLSVAVLAGQIDEGGVLSADPASYDGDGAPVSRLTGAFSTQTTYAVLDDSIVIPVSFIAGEPPVLVPLQRAACTGEVDDATMAGRITGVIPGDQFVDDVLEPLIPEEGSGGKTKAQLLDLARSVVALETMSDIDLGGGERGVSAGFTFTAAASTW